MLPRNSGAEDRLPPGEDRRPGWLHRLARDQFTGPVRVEVLLWAALGAFGGVLLAFAGDKSFAGAAAGFGGFAAVALSQGPREGTPAEFTLRRGLLFGALPAGAATHGEPFSALVLLVFAVAMLLATPYVGALLGPLGGSLGSAREPR